MKKELVIKLYNRLKSFNLNVNILPFLMNEKDSVIEEILYFDNNKFIEYINKAIEKNDVKKYNFSSEELKSNIAYKLALCTDRKILDTYFKDLIDKGIKEEQLINITNALKKVDNEEILGSILAIVKNERIIKSKKIVKLIESLSNVSNKIILKSIHTFIENSSKKTTEVIDLIIYISSFRTTSICMLMFINLANLIDDFKSAKKIIEIISNSTHESCAVAAEQLIVNKINIFDMKTIIKAVQIISKARGEEQADYARLLISDYYDINNIMELATLIANCSETYQASQTYLVIKENKSRNIDNLLEYAKLVVNSYTPKEASSLCKILINEDVYKCGNALKIAQRVTKFEMGEQMKFAAEFATNKKLIDRGIVFELIELCNKIFDERKFKLIYEIILRDEVLSNHKIIELADALTFLKMDEVKFVRDNMLTKETIENESFIRLILYLSYGENEKIKVDLTKKIYLNNNINFEEKLKIAVSISLIKNTFMLDCISHITMYIDVLGYEKSFEYIEKIKELDSANKNVECCVLYLKIIEETEKNILKQKTFLEIYQNSPELAIELLEQSEIPDEQDVVQTTRIRKNKKGM